MQQFLRHPLAIIATFALAVAAGLMAWPTLPVELLPHLEHPSLTVVTSFENASPEEVETLLTRPVEEAVGTVSGLRSMASVSSGEVSSVSLTFNWGTDMSLVAAEVREKLDLIANEFPREAKLPIVLQYDPTDYPVVRLALKGSRGPASLRLLAKHTLKPALETIDGVATVRLFGGLIPEVLVLADLSRLNAHSLDLRTVARRLNQANINFPGGSFTSGPHELPVRTIGRFENLRQINDLSIGPVQEPGSIRIGDIATVVHGHSDKTNISRVNGEPAILLGVVKESSANAVAVAQAVLARLPDLEKRLPRGTRLTIIENEASFVQNALADLRSDILWGGVLAFAVLLLFLRSFAGASLVLISIPISILATLAFMSFHGVSLNIMSIGGLALGVGMLLDSSIVVLESIHRQRREYTDMPDAVAAAVREVGSSVTSGTLTTLAVLLPVFFMTGFAQRLFQDFAFAMGLSVLMSLLVAVLLVPAIVVWTSPARTLETRGSEPERRRLFDAVYRTTLSLSLKRPAIVLVISAILIAFAGTRIYQRGFEILPPIDVGSFTLNLILPPDSGLKTLENAVIRAEQMLTEKVEVASFVTEAGAEDITNELNPNAKGSRRNTARIAATVLPAAAGAGSTAHIMSALRMQTASWSGVTADFVLDQGPLARVLGNRENPELLRLTGEDLKVLDRVGQEIETALKAAEIVDMVTQGKVRTRHLQVIVDRAKAAAAGITVQDVAEAVHCALEGTVTGNYFVENRPRDLRIRLATRERTSVEDLQLLPLVNHRGEKTLLGRVASIQEGQGPREILRFNGRRNIVFRGSIPDLPSSRVQDKAMAAAGDVELPAGYFLDPGSGRFELKESLQSMYTAIILAAMLVYVILVVQFESLVWPLVVICAPPFAAVGVALALEAGKRPVTILVLIGTVVLVGLIVNMAILLVTSINANRSRGMTLDRAVEEGAVLRFRPILMTTLTTVLGALPLCLTSSGAAELNSTVAVTVVSGLLAATVFQLLGVPAVYALAARANRADRT